MTVDDNLDGWTAGQLASVNDETMDGFGRRVVVLEPAESLDHREPFWQDAIVFVTTGQLVVECTRGERHPFSEGDVLTLAGLPILRASNTGATSTRLLVIWRRKRR